MILAQKEKLRNGKSRSEPTHLWSLYDKGGKNIQWRKDYLFNKQCLANWIAICERMKLVHSLTPYTKIS